MPHLEDSEVPIEATFINAIKSPTGDLTGLWKCEGIQVEERTEGR